MQKICGEFGNIWLTGLAMPKIALSMPKRNGHYSTDRNDD